MNLWMFEVGPDIHKIQIFTPVFCKELIECAEKLGTWSNGGAKHYDKRIGNTENASTVVNVSFDDRDTKIDHQQISALICKALGIPIDNTQVAESTTISSSSTGPCLSLMD